MKEFKVGDKVYITTKTYRDGKAYLDGVRSDRIKTITPKTGIIKLENSKSQFRLDGRQISTSVWNVYDTKLEPATEELKLDIARLKAYSALQKIDRDAVYALSLEELEMVAKVLPLIVVKEGNNE